MGKVKVELNNAGVRDLLRSSEMLNICKEYADGVQSRCGEGFEVTTHVGRNRVNAQVAAATIQAARSNMKHNTILKALK